MMTEQSNYQKYRGRCKELCDQAIVEMPSRKLVRGHYWCPIWNRDEPHWWTVGEDGTIYDPSKLQFPSEGMGEYTEFDGNVPCSECGKEMREADASFESNYAFCSDKCHMRFVGL